MTRLLPLARLVHPFPSFLVAALTALFVPLLDPAAPRTRMLELGLGMLLFQFTIGIVNELVDAREDREAKPWKPLVQGLLSATAWPYGS